MFCGGEARRRGREVGTTGRTVEANREIGGEKNVVQLARTIFCIKFAEIKRKKNRPTDDRHKKEGAIDTRGRDSPGGIFVW